MLREVAIFMITLLSYWQLNLGHPSQNPIHFPFPEKLLGLCLSFYWLADCTKRQYEDLSWRQMVIYSGRAAPEIANMHVLGPRTCRLEA